MRSMVRISIFLKRRDDLPFESAELSFRFSEEHFRVNHPSFCCRIRRSIGAKALVHERFEARLQPFRAVGTDPISL